MRMKLTFGPPEVIIERRPDGVMLARSPHVLGSHPRAATDWLDHWAKVAPDRVFLAERESAGGAWRKLTYGEARAAARSVAQALIDRSLGVERPVAILSGNGVDHALMGLGAMIAGVPYAPVSAPYSLVAKDFAKLKAIIAVLTPGLVFVDDGVPFAAAIAAAVPADVEIVAKTSPPATRRTTTFDGDARDEGRGRRRPRPGEGRAGHDRQAPVHLGLDRHAQGRHQHPADDALEPGNAARRQSDCSPTEPPVLIDWLPWSHTFGGNNDFNLVLANGGTFYIDEGRPLPGAIEATVRNLREISPTVYYNVPRGFEMLLPYLQADAELSAHLVRAAAGFLLCRRPLSRRMSARATSVSRLETVGEMVPMVTSFGSTETAPIGDQRHRARAGPRRNRHSQSRGRGEACPRRGQARSARQEPERHARLLARARADRRGVRRGGILQVRRCAAVRRRDRSRTGLPVRRPGRGGLQARHRHMGQRRTIKGEIHRRIARPT